MPDRNNVINYLESEIKRAEQSVNDIWLECVEVKLLRDALSLLQEHEVVRPKKFKGYNPPMYTIYEYECEKCKSPMMNKQPFCMGCGRQVKWE